MFVILESNLDSVPNKTLIDVENNLTRCNYKE